MVEPFGRFMRRFPSIRALAEASLDDVLAEWAGLGYYSRARNLHRSAQIVVERHGGRLPRDAELLQSLPGIGRSSAAAIRAQAWDIPDAILDGNARRVLSRVFALEGWWGRPEVKRRLWELAESCTPDHSAREYCQAIMDLGATLCRRRNPDCGACPWGAECRARKLGAVHRLPTPAPAKSVPSVHWQLALVFNAKGQVLLQRREETGIWGGLWAPPVLEAEADAARDCRQKWGLRVKILRRLDAVEHRLTHRRLVLQPVILRAAGKAKKFDSQAARWCDLDQTGRLGLPKPLQKLLGALEGDSWVER